MDDFVKKCGQIELSGIEVHRWQDFFKSADRSQKKLM
jgi:hypothetical protein